MVYLVSIFFRIDAAEAPSSNSVAHSRKKSILRFYVVKKDGAYTDVIRSFSWRKCVVVGFYVAMMTRTYEVYKGLPLSDMSPQERGAVIQNVVRRHLEEKYETTATSPTGKACQRRKRGRNQTTHEFFVLGQRNEVKNAQLAWDKSNNYWCAKWQAVKSALHDKLLLVLYTPSGLYVFEHDGKFGVTTQGKNRTPVEAQ